MPDEPQYLLPEPDKEIARLTEQDAVITHLMKNKRILAPIDLSKPGLHTSGLRPLHVSRSPEVPRGQKATPREIVRNLCQLVKPGGWIQLVEMDVIGTVHGPAMRDAWAATGAFLTAAGAGSTDYAKNMAGWLKEEGFENVQDEHVDVEIGARCKDPEWGARGAKILVEAFTGVVGACKMMNVDVPQSILENLPERAEEEMLKSDGTYPLVFASAQKPTA